MNPSTIPPNISGSLLHSVDSAGDNNDEGGINSSFRSNDDEDCPGPFAAAAMPSSRARRGSEKRKAGDGANPKRSCAFFSAIENSKEVIIG